MSKGIVVVLEGVNGSGKSGAATFVEKQLSERGRIARVYRDPGATKVGEELRQMLKRPEMSLCPMTQMLMFTAARVQLATEHLVPRLEAGEDVILDRWWMSTYAYQSVQGVDEDLIVSLNTEVSEIKLDRDRCFLLDVSPETAMERMQNLSGEGFADRFEEKGVAFQESLCSAYHELVPEYLTRIDAEMEEERVHARVWTCIEMKLDKE